MSRASLALSGYRHGAAWWTTLSPRTCADSFRSAHRERFGSLPRTSAIIDRGRLGRGGRHAAEGGPGRGPGSHRRRSPGSRAADTSPYTPAVPGTTRPCIRARRFVRATQVAGPAIIIEDTATMVVEPGWQAKVSERDHLVLTRSRRSPRRVAIGTGVRPGAGCRSSTGASCPSPSRWAYTLQNTAHSVNIKERLDFSCALFDARRRAHRQRAPHPGAPRLHGGQRPGPDPAPRAAR